MVHFILSSTKIIGDKKIDTDQIQPKANSNLHPTNRVKNMRKLQRNSTSVGLKVNPVNFILYQGNYQHGGNSLIRANCKFNISRSNE